MGTRNIVYTFVGLSAIICIGVYVMLNGTYFGKKKFRDDAVKYLKNKYPIDMAIDSIEYSFKDSSIFSLSYFANAYPKRYPNIIFQVDKHKNIKDGKVFFVDNFITKTIEYEVNSELNVFIKDIYKEESKGYIEITDKVNLSSFIIDGDIPKFSKIRDKLVDPVEINFIVNKEFNENTKDDELNKIFECLQFTKNKDYRPNVINFNYLIKNEDKTFKSTEFIINYNDLINISSADQIIKYKSNN